MEGRSTILSGRPETPENRMIELSINAHLHLPQIRVSMDDSVNQHLPDFIKADIKKYNIYIKTGRGKIINFNDVEKSFNNIIAETRPPIAFPAGKNIPLTIVVELKKDDDEGVYGGGRKSKRRKSKRRKSKRRKSKRRKSRTRKRSR